MFRIFSVGVMFCVVFLGGVGGVKGAVTYTAVDLTPAGFGKSQAFGVNGGQQVGHGYWNNGYDNHALLWSGTAASAVDLNPAGFSLSGALGVDGGQQVGHGSGAATGNQTHALLWSGTAASAVDLNPAGFFVSESIAISGGQQAGYGQSPATGNHNHAFVWSGTAASAVDLHQFLPAGFTGSIAQGIDAQGNIVGWAYDGSGEHAILWQPVPEPSALILLCVGAISLFAYAWRRRFTCRYCES